MPGLRVVDLVHADGVGIVVDRHIDVPANGLLDASAGAAATGKEVDHQLGGQRQDELRCEHDSSGWAQGGPETKEPAWCGLCVGVKSVASMPN